MLKVANVMLCVFYHNLKIKNRKKKALDAGIKIHWLNQLPPPLSLHMPLPFQNTFKVSLFKKENQSILMKASKFYCPL